MPNYCGNTLVITHEDSVMIVRAKAAFADGEFLNEFIPVPACLKGTASPNRDNAEELRAQCGYSDGHNFCVNEWGTKWDVGDGAGIQTWDDHQLVVYFDSAWAPPIAAYEKLVDLGFTVYATYYEPGSAFAGIYEDGNDDCYDLSGMDSGDVQQQLPQELDESFGISETMAEYEAENDDDVTRWYKDGVEATGLEPHKVKNEQ